MSADKNPEIDLAEVESTALDEVVTESSAVEETTPATASNGVEYSQPADWCGSVVSEESSDDAESESVDTAIPNEAIDPPPKRRRRSASASAATPTPPKTEVERKGQKQTISAIPTGADEATRTPVFEREADQIKYTEERDNRKEDAGIYVTLKSYLHRGRPLQGKIAGITMYDGVPCWSLYQGPVSIFIPFEESYMTIKKSMTGPRTEEKIRQQKDFLRQSLGVTVEFVLTSIAQDPENPDRYIATASRTTALAKRRFAYFGQEAKLQPGTDIACRIICISENIPTMFVTVAGLDILVHRRQLTLRPVKRLSDHFHLDDKITMRIVAIEEDPATGLPKLVLSAIPLEKKRCQVNRSRLNVGDRCRAIINNIDSERGVVYMWLDGIDYYAMASVNEAAYDQRLKINAHVLYEHKGFTDSGYSHGSIRRILPD